MILLINKHGLILKLLDYNQMVHGIKKDHIHIEDGRQVYVIPAGREVNEVLWFTPSSMNQKNNIR